MLVDGLGGKQVEVAGHRGEDRDAAFPHAANDIGRAEFGHEVHFAPQERGHEQAEHLAEDVGERELDEEADGMEGPFPP